MGRHRIITTTVTSVALLCLPASALASSTLLSGYGGPGQGNQAIIGSTLVGGGSSGGGGSGGGSGSSGSSAASSSIALPTQATAPAPKKAAPSGRRSAPKRRHPTEVSGSKHASKTGSPTYQRTAATVQASGGKTLGLTGADVLYMVLAACVLALTAVITGRVARRAGGTGGAQ